MSRLLLLALLYTSCGLGDSEMVECRCATNANTLLFPHCRHQPRSPTRRPATLLSTQIPDCPSGKQLFLLERIRPENMLANIRSVFQAQPEARSPEQ